MTWFLFTWEEVTRARNGRGIPRPGRVRFEAAGWPEARAAARRHIHRVNIAVRLKLVVDPEQTPTADPRQLPLLPGEP